MLVNLLDDQVRQSLVMNNVCCDILKLAAASQEVIISPIIPLFHCHVPCVTNNTCLTFPALQTV